MASRCIASAGAALATVLVSLLASSPALASGDANERECPAATEASPGFRAYLPDCRAYEMVTPPFKEGASNMRVQAVSSDSSRVIVSSLSAFASTEGDPLDAVDGAVYEFARSGSRWVASPLTPPASLSPGARFYGASADGTRVLWEVLGSSRTVYATDLDVREANGSFVEVGPLTPPVAGPPAGNIGGENELVSFAGASKDLSHVLFRIWATEPQFLWPGDTTNRGTAKSLYEYVGTGNTQPMLVGVCTSGTGGVCPNREGHLIGNCGMAQGSAELEGGGDTYNAVSASGEAVFFTPSPCAGSGPVVSEVYARLDQAETVAVSEPSSSQCGKCKTPKTVAEGRGPAVFQGASEDGSKVFFLTEQELLPGATKRNLYEYDFDNPEGEKIVRVSAGSPVSPVPEVQGVARVSEDGSHVYFVAKAVLTKEPDLSLPSGRQVATAGQDNLYVFERDATHPAGRIAFVATLSKEDSQDWSQQDLRPVQATPDGRFVVFRSAADLTAGDSAPEEDPQVFEYDALREELVRVSIGALGYETNANANPSSVPNLNYVETSAPTAASIELAVSADGSRVLFSSLGALTEGAEAGGNSVYEYRSVGPIENGSVYLIADGTSVLKTEMALDASGADAFFWTADPLAPLDVDTQFDLYDARVDGGFPAPVAPAACEGERCQGAPSPPPSFGAPGSVSEPGGGNLPAPVETPKPKPKAKHKVTHKTKGRRKREKRSNLNAKGNG